jgi:hypothetical protein
MGTMSRMTDAARAQLPLPEDTEEPASAEGEHASESAPAPQKTGTAAEESAIVDLPTGLRAIERLQQGITERLEALGRLTESQSDYLHEMQRAHNAATSEWYRLREELPVLVPLVESLRASLLAWERQLHAQMEALAEGAQDRAALQERELRHTVARVERSARRAIRLIALTCLLAALALLALTYLAVQARYGLLL